MYCTWKRDYSESDVNCSYDIDDIDHADDINFIDVIDGTNEVRGTEDKKKWYHHQ